MLASANSPTYGPLGHRSKQMDSALDDREGRSAAEVLMDINAVENDHVRLEYFVVYRC